MRRDVRACLGSRLATFTAEVEAVHVELVRHVGSWVPVNRDLNCCELFLFANREWNRRTWSIRNHPRKMNESEVGKPVRKNRDRKHEEKETGRTKSSLFFGFWFFLFSDLY